MKPSIRQESDIDVQLPHLNGRVAQKEMTFETSVLLDTKSVVICNQFKEGQRCETAFNALKWSWNYTEKMFRLGGALDRAVKFFNSSTPQWLNLCYADVGTR